MAQHQAAKDAFLQAKWVALTGYVLVAVVIAIGWSIHDKRLLVASTGLGYTLGIVGSTLMVLLLLYPLRKRARWLSKAGAIKHWFRNTYDPRDCRPCTCTVSQ